MQTYHRYQLGSALYSHKANTLPGFSSYNINQDLLSKDFGSWHNIIIQTTFKVQQYQKFMTNLNFIIQCLNDSVLVGHNNCIALCEQLLLNNLV